MPARPARAAAQRRRTALIVVLGLAVYALDQGTKWLVREHIAVGHERIELLPFLDLRHVQNTGIAFGLFADAGKVVLVATAAVALLLLLFLRTVPHQDRATAVGVACIAGGALGNLADRAARGHVTDFIHLPHWPTFNVADIAIVGGVALVLARQLLWPVPDEGEGDADAD